MNREFNPLESGLSIGGKILSMRGHNLTTSTRGPINSSIRHRIDSRMNYQEIATDERQIGNIK